MQTSRSASTFTTSPFHIQRLQPVDEVPCPELHVAEVFCQFETSEPPQQRGERDAHLHAGQRRAEAVVYTVAECQVAGGAVADVEILGGVDETRVPVA